MRFVMTPCHCARLRHVTRKVSAIYDAALAELGINTAQFSLLRTVSMRGPVSLTELGALTGLDRSTMGRNIAVLERQGLVATAKGKDKRESVARLSEQGEQTLEKAEPLWAQCQAEMESRLGPERLQTIVEINRLL